MTDRPSLYHAIRWYLFALIALLIILLALSWRWEFEHVKTAIFAFILGGVVVLLPSLWANHELETLVRYCHERHHEAKRKRRADPQPLTSTGEQR
jgi:hypothetical protein